MSTFQQVIIIGNVSSDVDIRYTPAGAAIANFSLATNKSWKDKNTGQKQEKAEFHRISVFGKLAEIAGEYVTKGSKLHIVGELETKKWQDKTGADRYTTSILVSGFQGQMTMLGEKKTPSDRPMTQPPQQQAPHNPAQRAPQNQPPQQLAPQQQGAAMQGYQQQAQQPAPQTGDFTDDTPF